MVPNAASLGALRSAGPSKKCDADKSQREALCVVCVNAPLSPLSQHAFEMKANVYAAFCGKCALAAAICARFASRKAAICQSLLASLACSTHADREAIALPVQFTITPL